MSRVDQRGRGLALALVLLAGGPVAASNGMNMIGFGAESIGMGGADLAATDSASAMNINPAGIGHCTETGFEFGLSPMWPSVTHADGFGNDRDDTLDRYPMPFVAYVRPAGKLTWGLGLFVQGGMGAEYRDLVTPVSAMAASGMLPPDFFEGDSVPATDDTRTRVSFAKFTPTVAWRVNSRWTLGASLNVGYAQAAMRMFPETSVLADLDRSGVEGDSPRDFLLGMDMEDTSAFGFGMRVGFQYRRGALSLGGAYFTETSLDLDDGTMNLNMSALGPGIVHYDAELAGFHWPRQAGLGFAYQAGPTFLIAGDVDWVNWASAIETVTIRLSNPDRPMVPPTREIPFRMDWEDQWVWAIGVEWKPAENRAVRFGFNHGDSPIPDATLRPLFPAIGEDHVTAGFGLGRGAWTFDLGVEYVLEVTRTNNGTDPTVNPFGPGSRETLSQVIAHFTVRRML